MQGKTKISLKGDWCKSSLKLVPYFAPHDSKVYHHHQNNDLSGSGPKIWEASQKFTRIPEDSKKFVCLILGIFVNFLTLWELNSQILWPAVDSVD